MWAEMFGLYVVGDSRGSVVTEGAGGGRCVVLLLVVMVISFISAAGAQHNKASDLHDG